VASPFKTSITELNRLFGVFHDAETALVPDGIAVAKAWFAYIEYCKLYNEERKLAQHPRLELVRTGQN
jgi:hypothetical protein